jgi:four helix bundle protein
MANGIPTYEGGQDIRDRAFEFACGVVEFCKHLYDAGGVARLMVPQLINCSTSLAGMLEEARGAESRRDFISKCSIGLKETRESHVRLRVCRRTKLSQSWALSCETHVETPESRWTAEVVVRERHEFLILNS